MTGCEGVQLTQENIVRVKGVEGGSWYMCVCWVIVVSVVVVDLLSVWTGGQDGIGMNGLAVSSREGTTVLI